MADSATFNDPVNPHHYKSREIECIELVELLPFCEGNAVKYLWRAGLKGPALEDYKKALWYVNRARAGKALMAHRPRPFNWILQRALTEYRVGGIKTNLAFHRRVLRNADFRAGKYDTSFIEGHKAELAAPPGIDANLITPRTGAALIKGIEGADVGMVAQLVAQPDRTSDDEWRCRGVR